MSESAVEESTEAMDWEAAMQEQAAAEAQAASAAASAGAPAATASAAPAAEPASDLFQPLVSSGPKTDGQYDLSLIMDIPVQLSVELGRTKLSIRNLLQLAHGSVVELDAMAGDPMDVLVNGTLIAQGEIVVVNDKFGIRLTDIVTPAERMRKINGR